MLSGRRLNAMFPTDVLGYVQLLLAIIVLRWIYQAIYNIYFHPLASFPGPKIAAATRLHYIWQLLAGRLPFNNLKLHEKYGGIVRIAPNELSLNTAEGWRDVYSNKVGKAEFAKDHLFYATAGSGSGSVGLLGSSRERHAPLRRLVGHGFSEKALREQEPLLQRYCDLLLKQIYHHCMAGKHTVDMVRWYNFFTFDVIGDLTFAESFDCLETCVYPQWIADMFENVKASTNWLRALAYYPLLVKFLLLFMSPTLKKKRKAYHAMIDSKVRHRREQKTGRADFLAGFLAEGADASEAEMIATSRTLIIAGSETTATLLSGITHLLLKNRNALEKLVHEIRSSFRSEAEINLGELARLRYLRACLDEAMRVYPPVPGSFPRNTPPGGGHIGGVFVPEETVVAVTHYAAYHDHANFHLADDFIPERWLGHARFVDDNRDAFQPFSTGPRNCVGKNLAYAQMRLVLARLLWNFDLVELDPSCDDWARQNVYLLWDKPELLVYLKPVVEKPAWANASYQDLQH